MKYEKLQGMDLHYMVRNTNGESNSNSLRFEGQNLKNAPSRSTRIMSNAAGKRLPGTLINYKAFTIPNSNSLRSGIEAPQVNEQARIQTPHGSLNIWGTYDDPNFGKIDTDVTSIKSAVFKGTGTGAFKDVGVVRIFYDNDGSVLGKANLRKLVLFKEIYSNDEKKDDKHHENDEKKDDKHHENDEKKDDKHHENDEKKDDKHHENDEHKH